MPMKRLTDDEFKKIKKLVFDNIGVNLTEKKRPLIISRLSKRLRKLDIATFKEYIEYMADNTDEFEMFFNLITTNVTKFFREKKHFDYLKNIYLPEIEVRKNRTIRAWSAGCSTGEEPYTLAIVLSEYFRNTNWRIKILASDVNTKVLKKAREGIYRKEKVKQVPYEMLKKYFFLGTGKNEGLFKIKDKVKDLISFKKINLTDENYSLKKKMDIIFCRNVFIYFDDQTRRKVLDRFYDLLKTEGRLFIGHSERVNSADCQKKCWKLCVPTVYKKY